MLMLKLLHKSRGADMNYRQMAINFSGALWNMGCCPECGNHKPKHMTGCKKTYEKLVNSREVEKVFIEAFETPIN